MPENLNTAFTAVAERVLPAQIKAGLGFDDRRLSLEQVMTVVDECYVDKSSSIQEELWEAARKIRMYKNRTVQDYITKHRILRCDMVLARCAEI